MERDHGSDVHDLLFGSRGETRERPGGYDQLELVAVVVASGVAGAVGLWWLTGQVAAYLSGQGWPSVSASATTRALWAWPHRWGNPLAGYPSSSAMSKVSPVAWWVVLVLLIAIVVTLGLLVWREVQRHQHKSNRRNRWAQPVDVRDLTVRSAKSGRLVLGRVDRRLVAAEKRHSVLVVGPSESGKTTGLAVPALLEWRGPVVALSVKTDLAKNTLTHRSRLGETWVYDPCQTTELVGSTWSPISATGSWERALRLAREVTESARNSGAGMADSPFWYGMASQLLAPYLFAAAHGDASMGTVFRWVLTHDHDESKALLVKAGNRVALDQHDSMWRSPDQTRASAFFTLQAALAVYADSRVAASTASSEIDVGKLLDGSSRTLYVAAPINDQKMLQPLFSALLTYVIDEAYTRVSGHGPLDPPLLVLVDEAANVAPIQELPAIASTAASQGIQLVTVWQDLAQMRDRYHASANTVLNNHRARIVLRGSGDENTLRWVSTMIGDTQVPAGPSNGRAEGARPDRTEPLLPVHAARQMQDFDGVLLYGALPAAKLKLRPWYRDRRLRRLAKATDKRGRPVYPGAGAGASRPMPPFVGDAAPSTLGRLSNEAPDLPMVAQRAVKIAAAAVGAGANDDGGGPLVESSLSMESISVPGVPGDQSIEQDENVVSIEAAAARRASRQDTSVPAEDGDEPEPGA